MPDEPSISTAQADEPSDLDTYRREFREWLAATTPPEVPLDLPKRFAALRAWQQNLYRSGWVDDSWIGLSDGGAGVARQLAFYEELVTAGAPQPIGLLALDVIGESIRRHGSPAQQALLPRMLSGEDVWCQGFSEPGSGSDLASISTQARLGGGRFVVNGQKVWTSWAHEATWCALLARTDPTVPKHRGISYLLVPMSSDGITVKPIRQLTGDGEFNEVFFDDVEIPAENLVGKLNDGWHVAMDTLGNERSAYTVKRTYEHLRALKDAERTLRATSPVDDATARAFGAAFVAVHALEAQTRGTKARMMAGDRASAIDSLDKLALNEAEQLLHACLARALGRDRLVGSESSTGLDPKRVVHDHLFSRAASIYGGSTQVQRNVVSERFLGMPRER